MSFDTALRACLEEITLRTSGDVYEDAYRRNLYSTDASIYQVQPHAVFIPRNREDVHAVVEITSRHGVPILPRASGSSLAGQTVNEAIVIDFTRHLDRILEVDPDQRSVRVEPGVVLGSLNRHLAALGLKFGPDPASADRAAMGGVVSNNATGAHSILYGMAADHVRAMNVILSDGSRVRYGPGYESSGARNDLEHRIYTGLRSIVSTPEHERIVREHTPRHWRRCGGYNLDRLFRDAAAYRVPQTGLFNPAKLICGAEGTLAVIEDITLDLVRVPAKTALAIIHFDSLHVALSAVPSILETDPSAVELLDHLGMRMCRQAPQWRSKLEGFVDGTPECVLITEYSGQTNREVQSRVEALRTHLESARVGSGTVVSILDDDRQADVWAVRKMGLGFLMSVKGDRKPIAFIEDAAVPPEHLGEYVTGVEKFCNDHGVDVAYYAHASAGCIHIRPLVNTKSARELALLPEITSFAIEMLKGFGGALSSEHGDGRARSAFNKRFFGPELYGLYREVKWLFDPYGRLNPGNIVDAGPMTEHLRFGPEYKTHDIETNLDFSTDFGLAGAVEMCNGAGVCRKLSGGTMCPSFRATRKEEHSTRGRANALRAVLSGRLTGSDLGDARLFETMDLCLECKACASECPSSVDMARLKVEFLSQFYARNGIPRRARFFASAPEAARRWSGALAPVVNGIMGNRLGRRVVSSVLGLAHERTPPAFARTTFLDWRKKNAGRGERSGSSQQNGAAGHRGRVVLFNDTFNTFHYPEVSIAATLVLEAMGFDVILPGHRCCGRPALSKGLVDVARKNAEETIHSLFPYANEGIPIIGLEPSCLLTFQDEYASLLPGDSRVEEVARHTLMFEEFVSERFTGDDCLPRLTEDPADILFHGHCHQKALGGTGALARVLSLPSNYRVSEIPSGCCGMAGSFGFEKEHYDISMAIGEDVLLPAVRSAPEDTIIVASGVSCRQQIEHGTNRQVYHPAEVLCQALTN